MTYQAGDPYAQMGAMSLEIAVLQRELEAVRKERDGAELAHAEKIANALDEVAGNILRDRASDAIDGYNAAVMLDYAAPIRRDRTSVMEGMGVSVGVYVGGRDNITKKKKC